MAFTYDLASVDPIIANLSKVRLAIGDTIENSGVLPSGANYQDDEITMLIDIAGSWQGGAAVAMETLAARWANAVDVQSGDVRKSQSQQAQAWLAAAARYRQQLARQTMAAAGSASTSLSVAASFTDESEA